MKKGINGFTLIEILVALGILAIILVVGSNMFFTILKSSSKTKVLTEVKQNGDYVINVMERMIRNAKEIVANTEAAPRRCGSGMTKIKIKNPDDNFTEFACEPDKISSNSASLTSGKVTPVAGYCYFDCEPGVSGTNPDKVTINFRLSQAEIASRPEEEAMVNFQTTVTLRNY